jgi:glycosyltransferase involved in cell wall biosynthesis
VERLQALGHPVVYLHREHRQGYKAGALNYGLQCAKGRFVAVFDADFVPQPDFLKKIIPYFYGETKYGMVQARWGHLNQDYSLMTQAQSVLLDGHFIIEHGGRNRSGRFFNFNGTAGVWDRQCIVDGGGWQFDTLTEDLDLSYRAQLKGWKFLYVPEVAVPAELPVDMNGFKSQQHRWSKGSIQTAKKLLPQIIKSRLPFKVKWEACLHLLNNVAYVLMVALALMMPLSIYLRHKYQLDYSLYFDLPIFILATLSLGTFYACSQREIYPDWKKRLLYLPMNLALGVGMAVNNSRAVLEAVIGWESSFQRTAKYAISKRGQRWQDKKYKGALGWGSLFEFCLGLYFTAGLVFALSQGLWSALYCLLMFQVGFLYVGGLSLFQGRSFFPFLTGWKTSGLPAE